MYYLETKQNFIQIKENAVLLFKSGFNCKTIDKEMGSFFCFNLFITYHKQMRNELCFINTIDTLFHIYDNNIKQVNNLIKIGMISSTGLNKPIFKNNVNLCNQLSKILPNDEIEILFNSISDCIDINYQYNLNFYLNTESNTKFNQNDKQLLII